MAEGSPTVQVLVEDTRRESNPKLPLYNLYTYVLEFHLQIFIRIILENKYTIGDFSCIMRNDFKWQKGRLQFKCWSRTLVGKVNLCCLCITYIPMCWNFSPNAVILQKEARRCCFSVQIWSGTKHQWNITLLQIFPVTYRRKLVSSLPLPNPPTKQQHLSQRLVKHS